MKKITLLLLLILSISTFSQSRQLDSFINYEYDENTGTWIGEYKVEFTYNSNHKNTNKYDYNMESGNWELEYNTHYTYDENDNIIEVLSLFEGENHNKILQSYDSNNNMIEYIESNWDSNTNTFKPEFKIVYQYIDNLITQSTSYSWNSQWVEAYKTIELYV